MCFYFVTIGMRCCILGPMLYRETMDRWCERGILALILAILFFSTLATGSVRTQDFVVLLGLTAGVVLLWVVRLWVSPKPQFLWPPICWVVLAFVAYAGVRYLTADIEYVARLECLRVLMYAVVILTVINHLHGHKETQIIVFSMLGLGMVIASYAIYQFIAVSPYVYDFVKPDEYLRRGSGTFINPNHLAGFLEILVPAGIAYGVAGRIKPVARVLVIYASLVALGGIGVSVSRGGWIATCVVLTGLFISFLWRRNTRLPAILMLIVLMGGASVALFRYSSTLEFKKRFGGADVESMMVKMGEDNRMEIWRASFRMSKDHPWFGVGPGHFDFRFYEYRPVTVQARADKTHNDYLNTLVDWGWIGVALVAGALLTLALGVTEMWPHVCRGDRDLGGKMGSRHAFVVGGIAGLAALLIHCVVEFNMQIPAIALLAVTWMGLLSGFIRFATERYWSSAGFGKKTIASIVLGLAALCLVTQCWRLAREQYYLHLAEIAPLYSHAQIDLLKKAHATEPMNPDTIYQIGETLRVKGWGGMRNEEQLLNEAMSWFEKGMKIQPYHSLMFLRQGMCLDWMDRSSESPRYFQRAAELDPNGYYTISHVGWHYAQIGDYATARAWLLRSTQIPGVQEKNDVGRNYLEVVERRLREAAARK